MDADFIESLQKNHIALWNEKVPARREELVKTIYSNDIKMYDKDFILSGSEEVLGFIGKLLTDDPNFQFSATKPMQVTQNGICLFWQIITSGPVLTGMDFFLIENEKVQHLYVFMDANV
jgi:hypothetical protein